MALKNLLYLNLEVVAVTVLNSMVIMHIFDAEYTSQEMILLGMAVWIVYTFDRIRDSQALDFSVSSARHQFHKRHYKYLLYAIFLVMVMGFFLLGTIPSKLLIYGIILSLITACYYFLLFQLLSRFKEAITAVIYVLGISIPLTSRIEGLPDKNIWLILLLYFVMAIINLMILSINDYKRDRINKEVNMVQFYGKDQVKIAVNILLITGLILCVFLSFTFNPIVGLVFFFTILIYGYFHLREVKTSVLHSVIDLPLLIPGILILLF